MWTSLSVSSSPGGPNNPLDSGALETTAQVIRDDVACRGRGVAEKKKSWRAENVECDTKGVVEVCLVESSYCKSNVFLWFVRGYL